MHICTAFLRQRHAYSAYALQQKQYIYSADPGQACMLCEEAELSCLYCATAAIFSVFVDWFTLSTSGDEIHSLQQLLHVCISCQLVSSHTSKRAFSIINSTISEYHAALQQSKLGEQRTAQCAFLHKIQLLLRVSTRKIKPILDFQSFLSKSYYGFEVVIDSRPPHSLLCMPNDVFTCHFPDL